MNYPYGLYGTMPAGPSRWTPIVNPASFLDYTENIKNVITDPYTGEVDPLLSASLSAKPSGDGELVISRLSVDETGFLITWWMTGGVPGRTYTLDLIFTTQAGRRYQWLLGTVCDRTLASYPLPPPPMPGFGAPITWNLILAPVPALIYYEPRNFGAWPFGCQVTGPGVPIPPIVIPGPALVFNNASNFGAWPFGCRVIGPVPPIDLGSMTGAAVGMSTTTGILSSAPSVHGPALMFNNALNFGAWPFGCQVLGA